MIVGTLGKALGSYGAYVCCDTAMKRYLVNTARTLIFSTGPAPPVVAAALAALEILVEQPRRVERLGRNARTLRTALADQGLDVRRTARRRSCRSSWATPTPRWRCASACCAPGVFAQAIRPPTVPDGHVAAAPRRDGDPQRRRAAPRRRRARASRSTRSPRPSSSSRGARVYDYAA